MKINKYWFKPKMFGYGSTPITWEGWALVIVFIIYLLAISQLLKEKHIVIYFVYFIIGIIAIFVVSKNRTKEEWDWNWGRKKDNNTYRKRVQSIYKALNKR